MTGTNEGALGAVDRAIDALARATFPGEATPQAVAKLLNTADGTTLIELRDTLSALAKTDVSFDRFAAEAMLDSLAERIRKQAPSLSPEAAYARAVAEHPEVADLAVNG